MTKAYKLDNYDLIDRERTRFMLALNDQLNGEICWSHWIKGNDGERYRVGVARLEACDGGYVVTTFRYAGQSDYTTVHAADGFESNDFAIRAGYCEARTAYRADHVAA